MTDASNAPVGKRSVGRPARISREAIARAANELGLDGLTLRAVAERLGVSIASLYHHVSSKDDLLRMAVELTARQVPLPRDTDQHWSIWLLEWARYNQDAFRREPALLAQYLEGAISARSVADNLDRILGVLMRHGFTAREALTAYEIVSAFAIGMAVGELRQRHLDIDELVRLDVPDELPHLQCLKAESARRSPPTFEDRMLPILSGIAMLRGDDLSVVRAELRRFVARQRRRDPR